MQIQNKKKVIDVVRDFNLELANKTYKDIYGEFHNCVNLSELANLYVRDIKYNFVTNEAIIVVFDIEKIDKNK